jgi:hypothetical protein
MTMQITDPDELAKIRERYAALAALPALTPEQSRELSILASQKDGRQFLIFPAKGN